MHAFFNNLQISINFNQSTALFMCKMMNFIKIWAHQLKIWLQPKGTDYIVRKKTQLHLKPQIFCQEVRMTETQRFE